MNKLLSQNLSPPLSTELLQGTESEKIIPMMDKRILKTKEKRSFVLYVKMKCSFLGVLKCCMGL